MTGWSKSLPDLAGPPSLPIPRAHTHPIHPTDTYLMHVKKSVSPRLLARAQHTYTTYTRAHQHRSDKHLERCPEFKKEKKPHHQFENITKWEWHRMESSRFSRVLKEIDPAPATYPRIRSSAIGDPFRRFPPDKSCRISLQGLTPTFYR